MTVKTRESAAIQVIMDLKNQLISLFPDYPSIIEILPQDIFFRCQEIHKDDPMLAECTGSFVYNRSLFIIKIRHSRTGETIGIFFEKGRIRFRIGGGCNPENFRSLSGSRDKIIAIQQIILGDSPEFELVYE